MPEPLYLDRLYPGAVAYAERFRLPRLHILGDHGRPIATVWLRHGMYRIDPALPRRSPREPAINLAFVEFCRVHLAGRRR